MRSHRRLYLTQIRTETLLEGGDRSRVRRRASYVKKLILEIFSTCKVLVRFLNIHGARDYWYWIGGPLMLCTVCGRSLELSGLSRSALEDDVANRRSGCRLTVVAIRQTSRAVPRKTLHMLFMTFFWRTKWSCSNCSMPSSWFYVNKDIQFAKTSINLILVFENFERVISEFIKLSSPDEAIKNWL